MKENIKGREKVRLYRFFNFHVEKDGEPFALCDYHFSIQPIPNTCVLNKIADDAVEGCNQCWQEETNQKNR